MPASQKPQPRPPARRRERRARSAPAAAVRKPRSAFDTSKPFVLLFILVAAVYANSIRNQFVFDDHILVNFNPEVNPTIAHSIEHRNIEYRPFRIWSYVLDRQLGGHQPASYHIGNMVYHAITGSVALVTYQQLGLSPTTALLGAAIFVLHPVQTESVTYISGRRDVLCGLFVLLAFSLYLRWRATRGRWWQLALAVAAVSAGVLTKELALGFPLLIVAYDVTVSLARQRAMAPGQSLPSAAVAVLRAQMRSYAVLAALGMAGIAYLAVVGLPSGQEWWGGTPITNALNVALLWVHSGVLLLLPIRLLADYSLEAVPLVTTMGSPLAWAGAGALIALLAVSCWTMHRTPLAVFLLWWVAATLLPSSHVVPHHDFFAEHYLYLPLFGFAGLLALTLVRVGRQLGVSRRTGAAVCAALLLLYGVRVVWRNPDWHDDLTLWRVTAQTAPRCARARSNYGGALLAAYDLKGAKREFRAALKISPQMSAQSGMVMLHHAKGKIAKRDKLLRTMMLDPAMSYTTMVSLADWFLINKAYPEAISIAGHAANRWNADERAWNVQGWGHVNRGEIDQACPLFERALSMNPRSPDALRGRDFCRQHANGAH